MNPRATRRFVAYYRVSTDWQGQSGLGLDAQRKAIADYLNGGAWELVGEFTEVESGKKSERPELARAMDACRKHKAPLKPRLHSDPDGVGRGVRRGRHAVCQ